MVSTLEQQPKPNHEKLLPNLGLGDWAGFSGTDFLKPAKVEKKPLEAADPHVAEIHESLDTVLADLKPSAVSVLFDTVLKEINAIFADIRTVHVESGKPQPESDLAKFLNAVNQNIWKKLGAS